MTRFILLMLILTIISCNRNDNIPSEIVKPAQMQNVLWDMMRGDILAAETIRNDSTQNFKSTSLGLAEKILATYHLDRTQFEKSLAFYERHPLLLKSILDSLNAVQTRVKTFPFEKGKIKGKNYKFSPGNIPR